MQSLLWVWETLQEAVFFLGRLSIPDCFVLKTTPYQHGQKGVDRQLYTNLHIEYNS